MVYRDAKTGQLHDVPDSPVNQTVGNDYDDNSPSLFGFVIDSAFAFFAFVLPILFRLVLYLFAFIIFITFIGWLFHVDSIILWDGLLYRINSIVSFFTSLLGKIYPAIMSCVKGAFHHG